MNHTGRRAKPMIPKRQANEVHGMRRLRMRFDYGPSVYWKIVKDIQEGRAKFIRRQSRRVSIHEVEVNGQPIHAVYDSKHGNVVTVLFANERTRNGNNEHQLR